MAAVSLDRGEELVGGRGVVVVVMAMRSVSRVLLTSCGRMRQEEAEVTAKTGPLLRDGSSSDRTGRIGWGWGGWRGEC